MKTLLGILVVLIAVVGAGFAWRANFRLRATRAATAEAATTAARVAAESVRAQQQLDQSTARRAEIEQELAKLAAATRLPSSAAAAVSAARRPSTPTELSIRLAQFKGRLAPRYSAFYREMGFSAEQTAKFETLLAEQESRRLDLQATITGGALTLSADEVIKLRAAETARIEAEQQQLLGEDGYAQLQAFRGSEGHRRIVRDLVTGLALGSSPLSVAQEGQLRRVLAELNFEDRAGADREHWAPVIERAQAFLSPAQIVELRVVAAKSEGLWGLNELSRLVRATKR